MKMTNLNPSRLILVALLIIVLLVMLLDLFPLKFEIGISILSIFGIYYILRK